MLVKKPYALQRAEIFISAKGKSKAKHIVGFARNVGFSIESTSMFFGSVENEMNILHITNIKVSSV